MSFRTDVGRNTFYNKYANHPEQSWKDKVHVYVNDVVGECKYTGTRLMSKSDQRDLEKFGEDMKFLAGGRYIYYGGRKRNFVNNCYLFIGQEDTREEWARLLHDHTAALMLGGGTGCDYSVFRESGRELKGTGGVASGPLSLMHAHNAVGRNVRQGGSRRSALYASLFWQHPDIWEFMKAKDWTEEVIPGVTYRQAKASNFDFEAPLDMTNISNRYGDEWLELGEHRWKEDVFRFNVFQAMRWGDPGFQFDFGEYALEVGRNACTEITTADDSDCCNIGSINLARISSLEEFADVLDLASRFLICGTMRAELPTDKVKKVRAKNRRIGVGLMGVHEWHLQRGLKYGPSEEFAKWLKVYQDVTERSANEHCDRFYLSRPIAYRAIAPTGTISMLAGTTSGIEPLYAAAYRRRYVAGGNKWRYEYVVDGTTKLLADEYGVNPDDIETALDLAADPERRIAFQAFVQEYVDQGISSTINLPAWGTEHNNEDKVDQMAQLISKYAPGLRGITCYPDGAQGAQPLSKVPYEEAKGKEGVVYTEHDVCDITGGGVCGL